MKTITRLLVTAALLIAGVGGVKATETLVYSVDYSTMEDIEGAPFWAGSMPTGATVKVKDGLLVINNTSDEGENYSLQLFIGSGFSTIEGLDYKVKITYKTTAATSEGHYPSVGIGNWGHRETNYTVPLSVSDEFQTTTIEFQNYPLSATGLFIMWQSRKVVATISIQKVEVYQVEPVAPTRAITISDEIATSGSTLEDFEPNYVQITTTNVPELVFSIPFSDKTWERLTVEFDEAPGGDFVFVQEAENYDSYTTANSTSLSTTLNLTSRTHWANIALQAGDGDVFPRTTKIKRIYFSKGMGEKLETEDVAITGSLGSTNATTVVYYKGATETGKKAFEMTDVDVSDYKKLVLNFSSPTVGIWTVTYGETSENIPEGSSSYDIDVSELTTLSTLSLSIGAGVFPRYSNFEKLSYEKDGIRTMDALANDAIFSFDKATGYDSETKKLTAGGWTFETPVDLSNWQYLVITTTQCASNTSAKVHIADDAGHSFTDEDSKYDAFRGMVLDQHNNSNSLCIDLYYLQQVKGLDLTIIKSLTFDGYWGGNANVYLSQVYLTNYLATNMLSAGYSPYHDGDVKRDYTEINKFGTICLPYKASVAGAIVYSIVGKTESSIILEEVEGLLEAGKPYFYKSNDAVGPSNNGSIGSVNFFRADWTGSVAAPVANNGLIGTFEDTKAPLNSYVLSSNQLYQVDAANTVNVRANKAYVDLSQITNTAGARSINLMFNEPTGINAVSAEGFTGNGEFYNLQGQRVSAPRKGLYIVNGKVIVIK